MSHLLRRTRPTTFQTLCFILFSFLFAFPVATYGQTTWDGSEADDFWFNADNWDSGIAPSGITDDVIIGAPSPTIVNGSVNLNSLTVGADGIVNANASLNFNFGGTATTTLDNLGVITVGNNSDFQLSGMVNNGGSIAVNSTGSATDLEVVSAGATLSGGGTITLNHANSRIIGLSGAVLTLTDQTIEGFGQLGVNAVSTDNTVGGLIDANSAGNTLIYDASSADGINAGIMRASSGGILRINGSVINNTGGSIESLAGSIVEITGGTSITGGTLSGAGTFNVLASTNVFLTDLTHSGTMTVGGNTDLGLTGAINNSGSITFDGSGSTSDLEVQAAGATLTGGGTITLDGDNARIIGLSSAVLTLTDQTVEGFGQVGVNAIEIHNSVGNLIDANVLDSTLTFDTNAVGATNSGTMRASSGGILLINGSVIDNTGGSIEALSGSIVELTGGTSITGGTLSGAGTFNVLASTNVFLTDLTHSGTMTVGGNTDLGLTGAINNSGSITFDGSGSTSDLEVQAGGVTLTGGGTITLDGDNARIIGLSSAVLTLTDQTVEGFGQVGVNALEILNSSGNLINANVLDSTLTIDANSSGATNAGIMRASGGGILRLTGSVINNTGGSIESLVGSTVELTGGTSITGGTLSGAGTFNVPASQNEFLTDLTHSGTMTVGNNADLGLTGAINNTGSIAVNSTGTATDIEIQAAGATLTGGGTITLNHANSRINGSSGAVLTISNQTIQGHGNIGGNAIELLFQGGLINANVPGETLLIDQVTFIPSFVQPSEGTDFRASNGGTLELEHGIHIGDFGGTNPGTLHVESGSTVDAWFISINNGSTLSGDGTITTHPQIADTQINGVITPGDAAGDPIGTLNVFGDIHGGGEFQFELASATSYDRLRVQPVSLGRPANGFVEITNGILAVSLLDEFIPDIREVF